MSAKYLSRIRGKVLFCSTAMLMLAQCNSPSEAPLHQQSAAIFSKLFGGNAIGPKEARKAGFIATQIQSEWHGTQLSDPAEEPLGNGIYQVRKAYNHAIALTAPHATSDLHTGQLAQLIFSETPIAAFARNSVDRGAPGIDDRPLDLARETDHPFTSFASAFAQAEPAGLVVQLHGFGARERGSLAASQAAMIISNGTQQPSELLLDLADCLSLALAPAVALVYPIETAELGALTNAQGQVLHKAGFDGFVHLELSLELRKQLLDQVGLRSDVTTCLQEHAA